VERALADRLMDMCAREAGQIAELWYKSLSSNPRTRSYRSMPKEGCLRHAVSIYRNLGQMYFADDCYKAVDHTMDVYGFAEDNFARGIPLTEVIYSLILLRRHIWLYAESQALYSTSSDMVQAVDSINRVLLIFDYATYNVSWKYKEILGRTDKSARALDSVVQ
jgi:hypothetical protein